ncbi:hypothetical protein GHK46_09825 [Sinorhizobium medicae]|nr:hypothetical protein [Sinorhizobium medicae]MQV97656.1 hypothetical protein [Sinorhizobium medicae]
MHFNWPSTILDLGAKPNFMQKFSMAAKKKKKKSANSTKASDRDAVKEELLRDAGGLDWG